MKKISLVLVGLSLLFASCSKDETKDPGNNNQQQQGDDQSTLSIVGKWTAKDIKISGEHTIMIEEIPFTGKFDGAATDETVGNVTYDFKETPKVVVTSGTFDAKVSVDAAGFEEEFDLKDQVFGTAGTWTLSDDGEKVIITDAVTKEETEMDIVFLSATSLKLKGEVKRKMTFDAVGEIEPTLLINAEFVR